MKGLRPNKTQYPRNWPRGKGFNDDPRVGFLWNVIWV
jgi:hypothetical protein